MRSPERSLPCTDDRHAAAASDLSASMARPVEGECLVCFLLRAVRGYACSGDLAYVETFRLARAPAAVGVADRLERRRVHCACRALARIWRLAREHAERDLATDELRVPEPPPGCRGVRPGSAQPCSLWTRERDAGVPRQSEREACQARATTGAKAPAMA